MQRQSEICESETLLDTWRRLVAQGPDKLAVIDGGTGRAWSRGALDAAAAQWLASLPAEARGRLRRRRVVMAEPNGARWFQVFLGLLEAGAAPALADSKEAAERLAVIAEVTRAAAVWSGSEGRLCWGREWERGEFARAGASLATPDLGAAFPIAGVASDAPTCGEAGRETKTTDYAHACRGQDARAPGSGGGVVEAEARGRLRRGDLCLVKLTSGSTGAPRALDFTHAQMLADGRQLCAAMGIGADDLNLAVIPLGHSYGLGNLVVPLLEQGTPVLCAASPFPQAIAEDCARWKPSVFPAVPVLLRALAGADVAAENLASLRLVISSGAPLAREEAAAFAAKFGRRVHNFYGSSETGGIAYDAGGGAAEAGAAGGRGVGRIVAGVTLHWRRGKRFAVESAAVAGRGRRGKRGRYTMPDRGEMNALGELVLLGRAGRTLKIAGRRLDPAEVENALRALPGVRDAFVAAHPARRDALAAVVAVDAVAAEASSVAVGAVVATTASATTVAEWRGQLARRMAAWKIPDRIHIVSAFPVTQRGKVDRAALSRMLAK